MTLWWLSFRAIHADWGYVAEANCGGDAELICLNRGRSLALFGGDKDVRHGRVCAYFADDDPPEQSTKHAGEMEGQLE